MVSDKIFGLLAAIVVCVLLLAGGCTEPAREAAKSEPATAKPIVEKPPPTTTSKAETAKPVIEKPLPKPPDQSGAVIALKFLPQDTTTYRLTTQADKSVKFEGPMAKDPQFTGGITGNKIEMTFTQRIESVDEKGNAVAKITIKDLKYSSMQKSRPTLDFDSSREQDKNSPLARLIGQSYTITITPAGKVLKVGDLNKAISAVKGLDAASKAAMTMLRSNAIMERHGLPALPAADKNRLNQDDKWSSLKSFDFKMMGPKTYEKIYTVKEIKDQGSRKIVTVEMNAIPSSQAEDTQGRDASAISRMIDDRGTYTGELKFDAAAGRIESYRESLNIEWIMVDPGAAGGDEQPNAIKMGAAQFYHLQRID